MKKNKSTGIFVFVVIIAVLVMLLAYGRFTRVLHLEDRLQDGSDVVRVYKQKAFPYITGETKVLVEHQGIIRHVDTRDLWEDVTRDYNYVRWEEEKIFIGPGFNDRELSVDR